MTRVVFDASFVIPTLVAETSSPQALAYVAANGFIDVTAPLLLKWEVANALAMKLRRQLILPTEYIDALAEFQSITIDWDSTGELSAVSGLARRHELTVYDAAYLELAIRLATPIVTFDRDLRKAATAEGVTLAV